MKKATYGTIDKTSHPEVVTTPAETFSLFFLLNFETPLLSLTFLSKPRCTFDFLKIRLVIFYLNFF